MAMDAAHMCDNATYAVRIDDPDHWNFCPVPESGYDAILFAALAVLVACLASSKMIWVLLTGALVEAVAFRVNLGHLGNSISLWLGIRPADVFIFVFLPPLLLSDAARADFFLLRKMSAQVTVLAVLTVAVSALALVPIMLYGLDLQDEGWSTVNVALFGSMIASTDAVAVSSTLKSGGAPHALSVLLEAEALFNDASSITLFEIFRQKVMHPSDARQSLATEVLRTIKAAAWLASGGAAVGVLAGIITRWLMRLTQVRGGKVIVEVMITVAMGYLSFFVAQVYLHSSGVIAVVVYGLYGSATTLWGMSAKARASGAFAHTWQSITFALNSLVFFFVGASCTNFFLRSSSEIFGEQGSAGLFTSLAVRLPVIYLSSFALRAAVMFATFPLLHRLGSEPVSWRDIVFATVGGVRGSLSLILAQSVVAEESSDGEHAEGRNVRAQIALWTAGFVVLTLLINAPLLKPLIKWLDLDKASKEQLQVRQAAAAVLQHHTRVAIKELKESKDELLRGVNWKEVERVADLSKDLKRLLGEGEEERHQRWQRVAKRRALGKYAASAGRLAPAPSLETGDAAAPAADGGGGGGLALDIEAAVRWVLDALPLGVHSRRRQQQQQRQQQGREQQQQEREQQRQQQPQEQQQQQQQQRGRRWLSFSGGDAGGSDSRDGLQQPLLQPDIERGMPVSPQATGTSAAERREPAGAATAPAASRKRSQSPGLGRRSVSMPAMSAEPQEEATAAADTSAGTSGGNQQQGSSRGQMLDGLRMHITGSSAFARAEGGAGAGGQRPGGGVRFREPQTAEGVSDTDPLGLGDIGLSAKINEQDQRLKRLEDSLFEEDELPSPDTSQRLSAPGADVDTGNVPPDAAAGDAFAAAAAPPAGMPTAMPAGASDDEVEEAVVEEPEITDVWSPTMAVMPVHLAPGSGREGTLTTDGAQGGYAPDAIESGEVATHYNLLRLRSNGMWDIKDGGHYVQKGLNAIRKAFPDDDAHTSTAAAAASSYAASIASNRPNTEQVLQAYRVKLYGGFKRYFHYKNSQGLLGAEGLRVLGYCCDLCSEKPDQPLHLWSVVEREALRSRANEFTNRLLIWCRHRAALLRHGGGRTGRLLSLPFAWTARWLYHRINRATAGVLELAIELWLALLNSPQSKLLERSSAGHAGIKPLLQEVQQEAEKVWWFILHREVEAPGRFQAIQTFRAQRALLAQQLDMIEELAEQGVLDEADAEALVDVVQARRLRLQRRGPRWRQMHVSQMLQESIAFKGVSLLVFDYMRAHSTVSAYKKGTLIFSEARSCGSSPGFYLVISGMVRIITRRGPTLEQHYQGTGTVFGLIMTLVGRPYPQFGLKEVYAEGGALGKGPVIMHVPPEFIQRVREQARAGNQQCRQLETSLFLFTANIVYDLMRDVVVRRLVEHIRDAYFAIVAEPVSAEVRHRRLMALLQPRGHIDANGFVAHAGARKTPGTTSRLVDTLHDLLQEAEEKEQQEQEAEEVESYVARDADVEDVAGSGSSNGENDAESREADAVAGRSADQRGKQHAESREVAGDQGQKAQQQEAQQEQGGQQWQQQRQHEEEELPQALRDAMKERAVAVWDAMRAELGQRGMLLSLAPHETFLLRSVAVLMDGSLTEELAAEAPTAVAAAAQVRRSKPGTCDTAGVLQRSYSVGSKRPPPPADADRSASKLQLDSSRGIGARGAETQLPQQQEERCVRQVLRPPAVLAWLPSQLHSLEQQAHSQHVGGVYRAGSRGAVVVTCLEANFAALLEEGIFKGAKAASKVPG